MILLDTGVLAEAMKPEPDAAVMAWLDAQQPESLYITNVSIAELLVAIGVLPDGERKDKLAQAVDRVLQLFANRILIFETLAAWSYADLAVNASRRGKSYATADLYFAAIAAAHQLPVATRDVNIYEPLGLVTIDPWAHRA